MSTRSTVTKKIELERKRFVRLVVPDTQAAGAAALKEAQGRGRATDVVFENGKLKIVYMGAT